MENAPVINMDFCDWGPGVEAEIVQRFIKWVDEIYLPMYNKLPGITGSDQYKIIRKNLEYPEVGTITHYENKQMWQSTLKSSERAAVVKDISLWSQRGVREGVWSASYELVRGFRSLTFSSTDRKDTKIENAPLMHIEAYLLTQEEWEKYNRWFDEYGARVFIPLFLKNCGLKGYDYLKHTGFEPTVRARETNYPHYISLSYFEDLKAFEHFQESPEEVGFTSALRNIFPYGMKYKWYMQYQLTRSWRE